MPRAQANGTTPRQTPEPDAIELPAAESDEEYTGRQLDPQRGLVVKLSEVLGLVSRVPKRGFNRAQNYHFAREGDVADMIRPLLSRRHLFLHQSVREHAIQSLYQTQRGGEMWLTVLAVDFTWMDGDSKENLRIGTFTGYGSDTGDKGANKAMTSAAKYALLKTFMISTGEDSEADARVDEEAEAAGAARRVNVQGGQRSGRGQAQPGGRQQQANAPATRQLGELLKAAGATNSSLAAKLIGELLGEEVLIDADDQAGSLAAFIATVATDPNRFGKLIFDLRKHVEGLPKDATFAPTPAEATAETAPAAESPDDDFDAGSPY